IERPMLEPRRMGLELTAQRGSKKVLEVTGLRRAFGADGGVDCERHEVLRGVDLLVRHGERVALLGPNGAGKSVLFRIVLGEMAPDAGEVRLGPSITVAYYAQEHETLDPNRTAIEEIRHVRPMHEGAAMAHLGRFL